MITFKEFAEDNAIKVGDKVAYSSAFLKSTGEHTGPLPFARGIVTAIKNHGPGATIATVEWDAPEAPASVHVRNLVKADKMHLEPS